MQVAADTAGLFQAALDFCTGVNNCAAENSRKLNSADVFSESVSYHTDHMSVWDTQHWLQQILSSVSDRHQVSFRKPKLEEDALLMFNEAS